VAFEMFCIEESGRIVGRCLVFEKLKKREASLACV
jgi:hypothetical protein